MIDPYLSRDWADQHERLSSTLYRGFARLARTVSVSLDRLHHYEFDAPWKVAPPRRRLPRSL